MNSQPWWQSWVGIVGVLLGFLLSQGVEWIRRRSRRRAHWGALGAEMDYCLEMARTYRDEPYAAPLYRLSTVVYFQSFAALLGDAGVRQMEAQRLMQFFTEVATLNRGLDQAQEARGDNQKLIEERGRNLLKVKAIEEYYKLARAVVDAHL